MKDNSPVFWKMRDGRLISVDDMDLNHLRNVLKMIIRNREKAIMAQKVDDSYYSDIEDIQWSDGEFYKD